MKSKLLAFVLCALLVPTVNADQPAADARRPLLWKVSGADNSVYLLGSFHLLKAEDHPMPAEVDRAFDDSQSLLFEIEPRELEGPEMIATTQKYIAYEDGKSLSTVLPADTLKKLDALVTAVGGKVQSMEQTEPWMINLGMLLGVAQTMGLKPELGMDRKLMERVAKVGKPTAGLESYDDQMKAFDSTPHAEQVEELDEFISDPPKAIRQIAELHAAWRAGDVAKLDAELRAEMASKSPETYRLLNVERNRAWLPLVEKRLTDSKKDNTLVVVGVLHLLGSDGLVARLKTKGYRVERVCDHCAPADRASP